MSKILPLLLLLAGCPPKAPAPPTEPPLTLEQDTERPAVGEPVGPGPWHEEGGLGLEIPEGWEGRTGPPGSGLLVSLRHAGTGVQVEIWAFALSGQVGPRPRPGCEWMFTDTASHRLVPALAPAVTATCLADDPQAPVVQGWYGRVHRREVQVEVLYPAGRIIEGRSVVEPLLESLTSA